METLYGKPRYDAEKMEAMIISLSAHNDTLTTLQVASILGTNDESVRRRIKSQKLRAIMYRGSKYLVAKKWLIEYVETHGFEIPTREEMCGVWTIRKHLTLEYCTQPRTSYEIQIYLGLCSKEYLQTNVTRPLINAGLLSLLYPDKPHRNDQAYISFNKSKAEDFITHQYIG